MVLSLKLAFSPEDILTIVLLINLIYFTLFLTLCIAFMQVLEEQYLSDIRVFMLPIDKYGEYVKELKGLIQTFIKG